MKKCPNCNEQIKESYKFCPNCKISFSDFKDKSKFSEKNEKGNYKFCIDCGKKNERTNKFCSECGKSTTEKKIENQIDNSLNKMKSGFSAISKEISESETVQQITKNGKNIVSESTEKGKALGNKFLKILGVIGIIVIGIMILQPIITEKDFIIKSAFERNFKGNYNNYFGFIGGITAPIILPLIFIYLGFKKNKDVKGCLLFPLTIGLIIFILVLITK